jgi:hypothetical protein
MKTKAYKESRGSKVLKNLSYNLQTAYGKSSSYKKTIHTGTAAARAQPNIL